jgi:hypothetical protein
MENEEIEQKEHGGGYGTHSHHKERYVFDIFALLLK